MALVRRRQSIYYFRSYRENGKVKRAYIGSGEKALLAADIASYRRTRQELELESVRAEGDLWQAALCPLQELIELSDMLLAAVLLCEGYHRPDRASWRIRNAR